jgi:hypothetical protein
MGSFYAGGSRAVDTIKEGNLAITGGLTLAFRDKTELIDRVKTTGLQSAMSLYVRGSSAESATETVDLTLSVKWNTWDFSYANDGADVMETATFIASTLTVAEVTN